MKLQKRYCKERNLPMFVSNDGKCWSCNRLIPDTDKFHITGCPYCHRSFCD